MSDVEEEMVDFGVEVIETFALVDVDSITAASPKRYIAAARAGKFQVLQAATTRTLQRRPPFKSGKRAGQPQADLDVKHLWLLAGTKGAYAFLAHFADNRFESAKVWDLVGWPQELRYEYKPVPVTSAKYETEESFAARVRRAEDDARKANYDFNDGALWTNPLPRVVSSGADFDEWLADFVPEFEPRKKPVSKKKKQATANAAELVEIGVWNG